MSKRCCAKNCFNSVLYNRNIAYFSFPKNKEFAERWAELAGRNDLKEKSLSRIVKYYLCSEHFTANCFVDKNTKQALRRNLPHSIAIPTIFKNNLQETMHIANPRQSIEVHNIILFDDKLKATKCADKQDVSTEGSNCFSQKDIPVLEQDVFILDDFENQQLDGCPQSVCSESEEVNAAPYSPKTEKHREICRLCFKELQTDEAFIKLEESLHLKNFIGRVMSDQISVGDDMSQVVCKNCENNALLCLIIIQQMDAAQKKMTLPENK